MLKIIVSGGKYHLIREIDKVVWEIGTYLTMAEATQAKKTFMQSDQANDSD